MNACRWHGLKGATISICGTTTFTYSAEYGKGFMLAMVGLTPVDVLLAAKLKHKVKRHLYTLEGPEFNGTLLLDGDKIRIWDERELVAKGLLINSNDAEPLHACFSEVET